MEPQMAFDIAEASRFIEALTGNPDTRVTWQTFADSPALKGDKSLCGWYHGTLAAEAARLATLNRRGAGVFVTVNQTDGEGRRSENVTGLRALFIDDDAGRVIYCAVPPSIRVQSKRGQQLYWILEDGEPLDLFRPAQLALAEHFGSDPSVTDLPRVMRVPGSEHKKGEPYPVKILETNGGLFTIRGLLSDLDIDLDLERIHRRERVKACPPLSPNTDWASTPYGLAALRGAIRAVTEQQEGGRHKALFAAAAAMGELVAGQQLTTIDAISGLARAAQEASGNGDREIDGDEIQKTIADGLAKGAMSPRAPEPIKPDPAQPGPGAKTETHLRALTQADALDAWRKSMHRQSIPTGISALDRAIGGGLPVGQVTILLGYTGTGKSEFCRQVRSRVAGQGVRVAHVDVELGATRILERDLAQASGIAPISLRDDERPDVEQEAVDRGMRAIAGQTNIYTISPGGGVPFDVLTAALDGVVVKGGLVILDSMQRLATGSKADQPRLQCQEFNNWCCWYAQTRDVAILMTSEQHRDAKGGKPTASDALTSGAESRSIEYQSDVLMALVSKTDLEDQVAGPCDHPAERRVDLLIAKNRNGSPGYIDATLVFEAPCWGMRIENRGRERAADEIAEVLSMEPLSSKAIQFKVHHKRNVVLSAMAELESDGRATAVYAGKKKCGWVKAAKPTRNSKNLNEYGAGTDKSANNGVSACNHSNGSVPGVGNSSVLHRFPNSGNSGNRSDPPSRNYLTSLPKTVNGSVPDVREPIGTAIGSHQGGISIIPPGDREPIFGGTDTAAEAPNQRAGVLVFQRLDDDDDDN